MSKGVKLGCRLVMFGAIAGAAVGFLARGPWVGIRPFALGIRQNSASQSPMPEAQGPMPKAQSPVPTSGYTPAFVPAADGSYEATAAHYHATLSAEQGLTYSPRSLPEPPSPYPLPAAGGGWGEGPLANARGSERAGQTPAPQVRVKLRRVARGGHTFTLFDDDVAPPAKREPAVVDEKGGVSWRRASGLVERFAPRGDGVEQSFVLEREPGEKGSGALEFLCDLELRSLVVLPPRPGRGGGLLFVDGNGHFAARYGQVMVRDSGGHGLVLEPQLSADRRSVSFAVPAAWLRTASWPVEVDPLIGSDFQISPDNPNGVSQPAVAAGANNFLVAWDDFTSGTDSPQLKASIVTQSGIASLPFVLSDSSGAPRPYRFQRVEVAFDGTANWLVVWTQDEQTGAQIQGALVASGAGSSNVIAGTIIGGGNFAIAATTGTVEEDPLVAFNGSDFVVAWSSGLSTSTSGATASGSQIYFTRVTSTGVVGAAQTIQAQTNPPSQALLFLAPAKQTGDTLLLYRENSETPAQTRATRITQDGTVRDAGGISLFLESATGTPQGFGRPIGAAFVNSDWNILSSSDQTTDSAVYLHHLSTLGVVTPPQGVFAVVGLGPTGSTLDQYAPAFAGIVGGVTTNGNPVGEWLFLRNEKVNSTTYHILGKRVGFDGTDQDPIPFQVDTSSGGSLSNAVAAQCGNLFLVAWLDGRRKGTVTGATNNIFGAFVDGTLADPGTALLPVISASPTSGSAPLDVSFDATGSSGTYDTLTWQFGDGTKSTSTITTHRYSLNGTFVAQLTLTKGYYSVTRTAIITVGTGGPVGQNYVGTPLPNSEGVVTNLFIKSVSITLDFTQIGNDAAHVGGTIDASTLPNSLTGLTGSVSIGSVSHPFALDAKGQFQSDASHTPLFQFTLNANKGTFSFQVTKDSLQAQLDALGAHNTTVSPAIIVNVPITVLLGTLDATVIVGMRYKATLNKTGTGNYVFQKAGQVVSGTFLVSSFVAQQQQLGSSGNQGHTFTVKGQLILPNGARYAPSDTGNFIFEVGDYTTILPSSQFIAKSGVWKFVARAGASGLKKFAINVGNGVFSLQLVKVPATGQDGSNLWLNYGNNIVDVSLNLSFEFDLAAQQHFSAGRYVSITRKLYSSRKWTLK